MAFTDYKKVCDAVKNSKDMQAIRRQRVKNQTNKS